MPLNAASTIAASGIAIRRSDGSGHRSGGECNPLGFVVTAASEQDMVASNGQCRYARYFVAPLVNGTALDTTEAFADALPLAAKRSEKMIFTPRERHLQT
jgi:hypothetical protein